MTIISEETIARFLTSTCSDIELADINRWIEESPENARMLFELERLSDLASVSADRSDIEMRKKMVLNRIMQSIAGEEAGEAARRHASRRRKRAIWIGAAAAAAILAFVMILPMFNRPAEGEAIEYATIASANEPIDTVLPDGTHVWLNKHATLKYDKNFAQNRALQLSGEAYFEVAHDSLHPFTVDGSYLDVTVLGTKFTFNSAMGRGVSFVSLIQGSVKVKESAGEGCFVLSPGQRATYDPAEKILKVQDDNSAELDAVWHDNNIPFSNASVRDIAKVLERLYETPVHVSASVDSEATYSGVTMRYDCIDTTLSIMANTLPIKYSIRDGEVWITGR